MRVFRTFKGITLIVIFSLLALFLVPLIPHVRSLPSTNSPTVVSDTTWQVYDADPALGPANHLGPAQFVCLNANTPVNCPPGATLYGHPAGGWTADLSSIPGAHWIWAPNITGTTSPAEFNQFFFSKTFQSGQSALGSISIAADDFAEVRVNGHIVGTIGSISDFSIAAMAQSSLTTFDLSSFLGTGTNIVTVRGENGPFGACCPSNYASNPAGVVFGFLAARTIQVSPNHGPVGTKVLVQGSGFPSNPIEVTFENAFVGTTTITNGSFTFTFDVPEAQAGMHNVEAVDLFTGSTTVATFTVTPVDTLSLNVDVGTLYFPGDTASIYTLATLGGNPLNSTTLQLQLTLTRPDDSVVSLNNTFIGRGVFKSTYKIPTNGPIGTYAVAAKAHVATVQDASALATFEVKLTWLSAQGPALATTGAALTGLVALGAVLWRKGVFRAKND